MKNKRVLMALMQLTIGGAETHVVELSKALKQMGYEIIVASNGGVYTKQLEENGIKHYKVPLHNKNPKNMLISLFKLASIIKKERIDICHGHARIPSFLLGILKRFMHFRFVTTAHWVFKSGPLLTPMTNWGELTIAVSRDIKDYLMRDYNVPEENITLTINGIDTQQFCRRLPDKRIIQEFKLSEDSFKIVYVSRMDYDRSQVAFMLCNIMPRLREAIPGLEVVIVGGGNAFHEISQKSNGAILTGSRTDIADLISVADVFIGVSRAALEAMSSAKATIVAGNEGYIGLFTKDKAKTAALSNFTCRNSPMPTEDKLFQDIIDYYKLSKRQKDEVCEFGAQIIKQDYSAQKMASHAAEVYDKLRKRVVISGYYGFKNGGDDALLQGMVACLRQEMRGRGGIDITVLSMHPRETRERYGTMSINRFNPFKVHKAIKGSDLLISGGGNLIQDITSSRSLRYYLEIIRLAKRMDKPVMLYANGIGPLVAQSSKTMAAEVLNCCDLITLRDRDSAEELEAMGVNKPKIVLTADPAFTLKKAKKNILKDRVNGRRYAVVSVRPWKQSPSDFCKVLAETLDLMYEKQGVMTVFVPMQYPRDYRISKAIAARMKSPYIIEDCRINGRQDAEQLLAIMAKSWLVIGMRLHSLIFAIAQRAPIVPIVYDTKIDGFLKYVGAQQGIAVEEITTEKLMEQINQAKVCNADVKSLREKASENAKKAAELL